MPTNHKTSLGLNSWLGTDKPKRIDFVEDNTLLDSLLTAHFNDTEKHLSVDDRTMLSQAFVMGNYLGDGQAQQTITMPFEPRMVLVFFMNRPAIYYRSSGGYYENNFAIALKGSAMGGARLNGATLTVSEDQTAPAAGGIRMNLNSQDSAYAYVAFR